MRGRLSELAIALLLIAGLGTLGRPLHAQPTPQQPIGDGIGGIPPEGLAQIAALAREKRARTPAERKLDSQLHYALKMARGEPIAEGVPTLQVYAPRDATGRFLVDVAASVTPALQASITQSGGNVIHANMGRTTLRAAVTAQSLQALAARSDVLFIQPRQMAVTNRAPAPARLAPRPNRDAPRAVRAASPRPAGARRQELQRQLATVITNVGSRNSEGDVTHQAAVARSAFGLDGTGVRIGVLSDGVENLAMAQALGDLGPVTVLPGQTGEGDEGTAMLEIIHDIAPGAELYFATAFTSIGSFADNIIALRDAGCHIIVDDVSYFAESPFQDGQTTASSTNGGIVTQAVNTVTASGVLFFSSAANSGNLNDGTSGVWEGDFVSAGPATGVLSGAGELHSFGVNAYTVATSTVDNPTTLYWSDPLRGSGNDYDIYRLNSAGTSILDAGTSFQGGTHDPFEIMSGPSAGNRIVIVKFAGANRFLHLNTNRGRLSVATDGEIHGHAIAADAYAVAATAAAAPFTGGAPDGPFPGPFNASNVVETFSSNGPRRLFFHANGAAITPGDFSSTGGLLRQKPDITAADGVSVTGVGGFPSTFYGTSASAPHAAALAALVRQALPAATPAQIRTLLTVTAIDIEAPGVDRDAGHGIIMPVPALQAAGYTPAVSPGVTAITPSSGPAAGGTPVVITGTGFSTVPGVTTVHFGTTPGIGLACITSTQCNVVSPAGAGTVSVRVAVAGRQTADTPADDFTYVPPPAITAITPSSGPTAGGTAVMITGIGFATAANATTVVFGATPATGVVCVTTTQCAATSPAGTGTVSVRVTVAGLTSADTPADDFTYTGPPAPTLTAITPNRGPEGGGTLVTITGTNFATAPGATVVLFGGAPATNVTCLSTLQCAAVAPPGTGTVSVRVNVAGQTSADTPADDFAYRVIRLLPEGATGTFFDTDLALANLTETPAPVTLTFFREGGGTLEQTTTVAPSSRVTIKVDSVPGLEATAVAFQVESTDGVPIVVERTMFFDATRRAGHTAGSSPGPASEWLFAEGSQGYFSTYVLVANEQAVPVDITLTFLGDNGPLATRTLTIAPAARLTVDTSRFPELANQSFGTYLTATAPVLAERAMYFGATATSPWSGGHASIGARPSTTWLIPEGATGSFFDTYILLANPQIQPAQVQLTYFLSTGETITYDKIVPAQGRWTQNIEAEGDPRLRNTSVSATVTSTVPIGVERSMYWPGFPQRWTEAHNSTGLTELATSWGLAEGRVGGPEAFFTYILLVNPSSSAAQVRVRYVRENGGSPIEQTLVVPAQSRHTIDVKSHVPGLADGETFGARIDVTNGVAIAVERSMYWSVNGVFWSGGSNAGAVKVP